MNDQTATDIIARESTARPGFLRIPDFMAYSGLGRSKVYELLETGALERVKVGRSTLIPMSSIDEWEKGLLTQIARRRTS